MAPTSRKRRARSGAEATTRPPGNGVPEAGAPAGTVAATPSPGDGVTEAGAPARTGAAPSPGNGATVTEATSPSPGNGATHAAAPAANAAEPAAPPRPRGEARDELLRAELEPLGPDERPRPLLIATGVAALLAVLVLVGATTQSDLSAHGGSLAGGVFLAGVLAFVAGGMYNRRYWAVLSFEALIAFQIIVSCLALTVVSSLLVAVALVVVVGLGGWLFWKLVRVMGRIQVTPAYEPPDEDR